MANGIDYFPLDCHLDKKFQLLEAEFGLKGFAVVVKLFQEIYGERGYYCEFTKDVALLFSQKVGLGCNVVSDIVDSSVRRGIFDEEMFRNHGILTSEGIQERFFRISKRKKVEVERAYLLVNVTNLSNIVYKNEKIAYKNAENECNFGQSKEKKSKGNIKRGNAPISADEYTFLVDKYGKKTTDDYIERTKKYHCCTVAKIEEWIAEDARKKGSGKGTKFSNFEGRDYDMSELERQLLG